MNQNDKRDIKLLDIINSWLHISKEGSLLTQFTFLPLIVFFDVCRSILLVPSFFFLKQPKLITFCTTILHCKQNTAVFFYTGSILYQKGYIDTSLDVKTARYKKGGAIKWIGFLTSMISTISLAYSMITA